MKLVPGAVFEMGSERFYPEEAPVRRVRVDDFLMDETPVTNAGYRAFVDATGYVTTAERSWLADRAMPAGSAVFHQPVPPGSENAHDAWWWRFVEGANWRHPEGPGSDIGLRADHPVVHVSGDDAEAYARWSGKSLPTESEWELAARGGLAGADYAWGDELVPGGVRRANTWHGEFPYRNERPGGWASTSPVRAFEPNAFGLYDLIGNVWEWTADWWSLRVDAALPRKSCCVPRNPRGGAEHESRGLEAYDAAPRRVLKGGSFLCAPNYCERYRPAARHPQAIDTSTSHIGFRCVVRDR